MIIILTTLSLIAGIITGYYLQPSPITTYILTAVSVLLFITTYYKSNKDFIQKPYFTISTWLLAFVTGLLCFSLHYDLNKPSHYTQHINNENTAIEGVISERLKPNDYSQKYFLKVRSVNNHPATGKILVTLPLKKSLHVGDKITFSNNLVPIAKPLNPYQFDYSEYMAKQNVFHQTQLKDNYIITDKEKNTDYYIEHLRNTLINSFAIHSFNPETTNIIKALLFGQRQDMDKETNESYTNAGVIHILAISGLHIAILFYILNLIIKPLKRFGNKGRLVHLLLILAFLWIFAFITGLSASVVRSVVMFSFISIGMYYNRSAPTYHSVAVSMLFLLLVNPNFLFDAGFQLSYLAVFAIVIIYPLFKRYKISKHKAVNYIADTALLSLIAQIGVLPLSLYYFNQFPLLFLVANIIVVPLSTIILIVALAVLALNFIYPDAALMLGKLLELFIQWMNTLISWIASLDTFIIKDIPFTFFLNISLYAIITLITAWLYKKTYKNTTAVLLSILLFQVLYGYTKWDSQNAEELIVFNNRNNTLITIKDAHLITIMSTDSLAGDNLKIKAYKKEAFNCETNILPARNILWHKSDRILILDSLGLYNSKIKPSILILTQSPKVNLERLLTELKPKQVIADATNYKSYIARWKATCSKQKIPFHATTEKGFYRLE